MKKEKLIFTSIASIIVFYIFNRIAFLYQSLEGDILTKINFRNERNRLKPTA